MAFNIGDKVVVTKPEDLDASPVWITEMDHFDGKICTVTGCTPLNKWLRLDHSIYSFAASWLRLAIAEELARGSVKKEADERSSECDPNGLDQHAPGAKLDAGKPDASLLQDFGLALLEVAAVGTFGAAKYTRGGWMEVEDGYRRYAAAGLRHNLKSNLEDVDEDSGLFHEAHEAWCALAKLELKLRDIKKREKDVGWPEKCEAGGHRKYDDSADASTFVAGLLSQGC